MAIHTGTYGTDSGRELGDHKAGTWTNDPLRDNCPTCVDPKRGCPVNAHGVEDCRERHERIRKGDPYGRLAAACATHSVPATRRDPKSSLNPDRAQTKAARGFSSTKTQHKG